MDTCRLKCKVIQLINTECGTQNACYPIVKAIHDISQAQMGFVFKHILRENNCHADVLAKHGMSLSNKIVFTIPLLPLCWTLQGLMFLP